MDPINFLQLIKNGQNPQQLMLSYLAAQKNPLGANLLELAQNNDSAAIEKVARNLCAQRGIDFDSAFSSFKKNLGV